MHRTTLYLLTFAFALLCAWSVHAAVPTSINVQGRLTDLAGDPLPAGNKTLSFSIYDAPTNGVKLWPDASTEDQSVTTGADGLWTAYVGAIQPLTVDVFADTTRWLEITVNDGVNPAVTLPRVPFASGPYAYRVATIDGASGGNVTTPVSVGEGHTLGAASFVAGAFNDATGNAGTSVILGGSGNTMDGFASGIVAGSGNTITSNHAFAAGEGNHVYAEWSSVTGGSQNLASGEHAIIGGGKGNVASGAATTIGGGFVNEASGDSSTIGGGARNTILQPESTIGGGRDNVITGYGATIAGGRNNLASATESSVGGGQWNTASSSNATVSGGENNTAAGTGSVVSGGRHNAARGSYAVVGGGGSSTDSDSNSALGNWSVVGGGLGNVVTGENAVLGGGAYNRLAGNYAVIAGGGGASPSDSNSASGVGSVVGGGRRNLAYGSYATIAGGENNQSANYSSIGGGEDHLATGGRTTIGGGQQNTATSPFATVAGGAFNTVTGHSAAIGGGTLHEVSGQAGTIGGGSRDTVSNRGATVAGGELNVASGLASTIGGGWENRASGTNAVVPGGRLNRAQGASSFAAGFRANAAHDGAFVWADSTDAEFSSTGKNQFVIRAGNGVGINRNAPTHPLDVQGQIRVRPNGYTNLLIQKSPDPFLDDVALDFIKDNNTTSSARILFNGYTDQSTHRASMSFYTRGSGDSDVEPRVTISEGGDVGIGTTSPEAPLHVQEGSAGSVTANANAAAVLERGDECWLHILSPNGTQRGILFGEPSNSLQGSIRYNPPGAEKGYHIRCGNNNVRVIIDSVGNVTADGCIVGSNISCPSDRRLKKNIETIPNSLDVVARLRGVNYEWKQDADPERDLPEGEQIGLIAQEVQEVVPQAVVPQSNGFLAVDYSRLVPLLIEAVKDQQKQIEGLRAESGEQQSEISELRSLVEVLTASK